MGIYDRDYYRREGPSFLGALHIEGRVCKWLIGINVAVFLLQILTRPANSAFELPFDLDGLRSPLTLGWFTDAFVLTKQAVLHGEVWRLLTYAFLHDPDNVMHIIFNMLGLWWFGSDVEDLYGPREFLAFYLVSAVAGGVVYVLLGYMQLGPSGPCLGASGAVTAVLVLCALHFPTRTIWFWVIPMPIWLFVVIIVLYDAHTFLTGARTGVAVTVHLAGAAFSFAYYKLEWRLTSFLPGLPNLRAWKQQLSRPRLRVYREEAPTPPHPVSVAAPSPAGPEVDEQLEAKLDAVLEKVARFGQHSLTEGERQILFRASEVYKKRRTLDS
jgi:membrane associated rhomboid family serine protease